MNKNVFLSLAAFLLIPVSMFADMQLDLLRKHAAASFDTWPYLWLTPLAHLIFAELTLLIICALLATLRQNWVLWLILLLVGLVFTFYFPLAFAIHQPRILHFDGLMFGELTRMVGALLAAAGLFQVYFALPKVNALLRTQRAGGEEEP